MNKDVVPAKDKNKVLALPQLEQEKPQIVFRGVNYALVSHEELDNLVGSFMQTFELNGDAVQREALKAMAKEKCRTWLNNQYAKSLTDEWGYALRQDRKVIVIEKDNEEYRVK